MRSRSMGLRRVSPLLDLHAKDWNNANWETPQRSMRRILLPWNPCERGRGGGRWRRKISGNFHGNTTTCWCLKRSGDFSFRPLASVTCFFSHGTKYAEGSVLPWCTAEPPAESCLVDLEIHGAEESFGVRNVSSPRMRAGASTAEAGGSGGRRKTIEASRWLRRRASTWRI